MSTKSKMQRYRSSTQSSNEIGNLTDVPTDDLLAAFTGVSIELMNRGINILDVQTKIAIDARWEIEKWVGLGPDLISKFLVYINGAAIAGSGPNLRIALFSVNETSKTGRMEELSELYEDVKSDWRAFRPQLADELEAIMEPVVMDYLAAMQRLKDGKDNGQALRDLAMQHKNGFVTSMDDLLSLSRPGRKRGPSPITAFILEQAGYIKQLHQCKTRGEVYEYLVKELENKDEVQIWLRNKLPDQLVKQSVSVQAFEALAGHDRESGGERLRQMERDHK